MIKGALRRLLFRSADPHDGLLSLEHRPVLAPLAEGMLPASSGTEAEPPHLFDVLLSAPGGPIPMAPEDREHCAIFKSGLIYLHDTHRTNARIWSAIEWARNNLDLPSQEPKPASMHAIRLLYGANATSHIADQSAIRTRLTDVIAYGARHGANDIQILFIGDHATIRFQVNGYLTDVYMTLSASEAAAFFTTAFYFCNNGAAVELTSENQIGSVTEAANLPPGVAGLRFHFSFLIGGRHLNIRYLYEDLPIHGVGLEPLALPKAQLTQLHQLQYESRGLIVIVAPTEHGKSTTGELWLDDYSRLYHDRVTIVIVDDPPERFLRKNNYLYFDITDAITDSPGAQIGKAILASLRVSPHVLRIGECRHPPQARLAFEVSTTGRLCLTTAHTDNALRTPYRFCDLNIDPGQAFDHKSYLVWISQRLVPCLCPGCRVPLREAAAAEERRAAVQAAWLAVDPETAGTAYVRGPGCPACDRSHGRDGPDKPPTTMPGLVQRKLYMEIVRPTADLCAALRTAESAGRRHWLEHMDGAEQSVLLQALRDVRHGRIGVEEYLRFVAGNFDDLREDLPYLKAC